MYYGGMTGTCSAMNNRQHCFAAVSLLIGCNGRTTKRCCCCGFLYLNSLEPNGGELSSNKVANGTSLV